MFMLQDSKVSTNMGLANLETGTARRILFSQVFSLEFLFSGLKFCRPMQSKHFKSLNQKKVVHTQKV